VCYTGIASTTLTKGRMAIIARPAIVVALRAAMLVKFMETKKFVKNTFITKVDLFMNFVNIIYKLILTTRFQVKEFIFIQL
jgi:hypothetical protein